MKIYKPDTCRRFEGLPPAKQEELINTIAEEEGCTGHFFAPPFQAFAEEIETVLECCATANRQYIALRGIIDMLYRLSKMYPWNDKYQMLKGFFKQMDPDSLAHEAIKRIIKEECDDDDF